MIKIKDNVKDIISNLKNTFISLGGEIVCNKTALKIDLYRGVVQSP